MPDSIGCGRFLQDSFSSLGPQNAFPASYAMWVSNNVAPAESLGSIGDWFINVTSNSLVTYQKTALTVWTPYCTLDGAGSTFLASPPLALVGGILSIPQASSSVNGYLSKTDWATFTAKQVAGSYLVTSNNLSDLGSTSAARASLGLGTAATFASTSFAPATTATTTQLLAGSGSGGFTNVTLGSGFSWAGSTLNFTISATAGGTNGQLQYNNSTALGGFTMSGDATIVPSTGIITVTKSGGVAFGSAAFTASTAYQAAATILGTFAGLSNTGGYLQNNGSGGLSWVTPAGAGNVSTSGTITSGYSAQWNGSTTLLALANTGTGNNVLATTPTLVTPILGTPTSGNLANCTFPTLNQSTSGTASNLSGTPALPSGTTATTQSAGTSNTTLATCAFVTSAITAKSGGVNPQTGSTYELVASDANGTVAHLSGGAATWTIPSYSGGTNPIDFPASTVITLTNGPSGGGTIVVNMSGSDTMFQNGGTGVVTSFSIPVSHTATIEKLADAPGIWMVNLN